ncbi:hypothetical protein LOTGIDRAFT_157673 [Lottia gigantea]|uniref:TNFR-Cys domain-containing protein n=1 Tax=Lottia gigantea TaxID=225164 RepID=V4CER9_LOTGI|nr:hypothetical protein LOTGIDRAFT_157673 [Lottia gigantea]ESP00465.1 hypothetical protein LOTGIDRAFT_157673 [Lottia gigantea]
MKGFVCVSVFLSLTALVAGSTLPTNNRELQEENKQGMYQSKQGHWCQLCPAGEHWVKDCENDEGLSTCKTCPADHYMESANHATSCSHCTDCEPERNLVKACTERNDTECLCPSGKYWHVYLGDTGICLTHRVCPGEILIQGTPWNDAVCGESKTNSESHSTSENMVTSRDDPILSLK